MDIEILKVNFPRQLSVNFETVCRLSGDVDENIVSGPDPNLNRLFVSVFCCRNISKIFYENLSVLHNKAGVLIPHRDKHLK